MVAGDDPMSIVYIHGVNVRDPAFGLGLVESLQRWISPVVASTWSDPLVYHQIFWGDIDDFRWGLRSRPRDRNSEDGCRYWGDFSGPCRPADPSANRAAQLSTRVHRSCRRRPHS
jgi:hypothetical protein